MAGQNENDVPVMIVCENKYIAMSMKVLMAESTLFKSMFSRNWASYVDPVDKNIDENKRTMNMENHNLNDSGYGKEENLQSIKVFYTQESPVIIPHVIHIHGFKYEAVKILLEWIRGYQMILNSCYILEVLSDMILFADFYDIQRPVDSVIRQIEAVSIDSDNLIYAMECVTKLERVELCKDVASNLENKCIVYFEDTFRSANTLGLFVKNNIANIDLVHRLLNKSSNLADSNCTIALSIKHCPKCNHSTVMQHCKRVPL